MSVACEGGRDGGVSVASEGGRSGGVSVACEGGRGGGVSVACEGGRGGGVSVACEGGERWRHECSMRRRGLGYVQFCLLRVCLCSLGVRTGPAFAMCLL